MRKLRKKSRENEEWYDKARDKEQKRQKAADDLRQLERQNNSRRQDTSYNRNNYHHIINQANPYRTNNLYCNFSPTGSMFLNQAHGQIVPKQYPVRRKKNPCDHNGVQLRCFVCESIYHFAKNCLETKSQDTFFTQNIVIFEADYDYPAKLRNLVSELRNTAILHRGAKNTVTGGSWINTCTDLLQEAEKVQVRCRKSKILYRSGDYNTTSHQKC